MLLPPIGFPQLVETVFTLVVMLTAVCSPYLEASMEVQLAEDRVVVTVAVQRVEVGDLRVEEALVVLEFYERQLVMTYVTGVVSLDTSLLPVAISL